MTKPLTILFQPPPEVSVPKQLIYFSCDQRKECGAHVTIGASHTHNPFEKRISTLLLLKNVTTSGLIQNYTAQIKDIAGYCKIAQSTLYRDISWLKAEGLLFKVGKHLRIASWKTIAEKYGIDTSEKIQIEYNASKLWKLEDALAAINDQRHRDVCYAAYLKKINGNPHTKSELVNHIYHHFHPDLQRLREDEEYFRQYFLKLKVMSFNTKEVGQDSFDFSHGSSKANPDIDMCVATYGRKDHYKVREQKDKRGKDTSQCMGYYHRLRKLEKMGIITVLRRIVVSDWRARKEDKDCHHTWVEKRKATMWRLPNRITINEAEIFGAKKVA